MFFIFFMGLKPKTFFSIPISVLNIIGIIYVQIIFDFTFSFDIDFGFNGFTRYLFKIGIQYRLQALV